MQNRLVSVPVLDQPQPQCRRYKALNIPVTLQPKFTATEIMHNIFFSRLRVRVNIGRVARIQVPFKLVMKIGMVTGGSNR